MANSIELQKVLVDYVAGFEGQFAIKEIANTSLEGKFGDDQGDTIYVKSRNYGSTYQTADLTGKMSNIETVGVPLTLLPYKKGASYSYLENTLELGGDESAILRDWSAEMADVLSRKAYDVALKGASTAVVSTGTFAQLGSAINNVKKASQKGKIGGMLSFDITTLVSNSGVQQFGNSALASKLYQGVIGNFRGADFIEGRTDILQTNAIFPASTVTITNTNGVTTAQVTPSVGTAVTIAAGTAFTLAGIYAVDELGNSTGTLRVFTLQENFALSGTGAQAINVGDVFFSGPRKNVSGAISGKALTNLFEANSQYATGVVMNENELMIGMKGIKPLRSNSATMQSTEGLPIRVTYEGSAKVSTEDMIWDVLFGASVYSRRGICGLYVKIAG